MSGSNGSRGELPPETNSSSSDGPGGHGQPDGAARRAGAAYQGAIEAVFAILISMGVGYWLDERYETTPRFLILGVVIGFGSFVLRLSRLRRLVEAPPPGPTPPRNGR
jgi:F0F1-type ATP synthase assembly protein I